MRCAAIGSNTREQISNIQQESEDLIKRFQQRPASPTPPSVPAISPLPVPAELHPEIGMLYLLTANCVIEY